MGCVFMDKYGCYEAIHEIEKEIFSLVKKHSSQLTFRESVHLHQLFSDRKHHLNRCCPLTEENYLAFKQINQELDNLVWLNRKRALEMARFVSSAGVSRESSNWLIKAYLIVDGDMGGIELPDDLAYGSDFKRMRPILASTQNYISTSPVNEEDKHFAEEEIYEEGLIEDPNLSHWNEPDYDHEYLRTWFLVNVKGCTWVEKYQGEISLVFQNLLRYRFWSIPDLLRLRYSTEANIELIADYSLGDKK